MIINNYIKIFGIHIISRLNFLVNFKYARIMLNNHLFHLTLKAVGNIL